MSRGRILRFLALAAAALSLAGCRAWCDHYYPQQGYGGCCCQPQPCCAPASNYPVQPQPCAPAQPVWGAPQH
ncbi:MAG TPA: hypothetical protein VMS17_33305 [Gemmataceae bacterium]|nr:hypothetical protein [Gemmataceae bacterium]